MNDKRLKLVEKQKNMSAWSSWLLYLCKCRTQTGSCLPGPETNAARLAPGPKQTVWNRPGYSRCPPVGPDGALNHLLHSGTHHPHLRLSTVNNQPPTLVILMQNVCCTCGSSCWKAWVSFLRFHQGNIKIKIYKWIILRLMLWTCVSSLGLLLEPPTHHFHARF